MRRFSPLFRTVLSAVLIALIFYYLVDSRQFVHLLASAKLWFLLLCVALIVADRFVMAWKWIILLHAQGSGVSFRDITELTFVSTFFGLFLPSILGGDVVRAYSLTKNISDASLSISSVLIDRTIGISSMMAVSLVSALVS
ncbi:MAG: flippase-like domain-containing protein, partial [Candidatus Aminicenantes bacterium]|nr:flippase-like domain-containing protein [Candidatus Aminicenantes bacterium]